MSSFRVEGGCLLKGELIPQGAKNEALQVLCAVLLTPELVTISNIPNIIDVNKVINDSFILTSEVIKSNDIKLIFDLEKNNKCYIFGEETQIEQLLINLVTNAAYSMKDLPKRDLTLKSVYNEIINAVEILFPNIP